MGKNEITVTNEKFAELSEKRKIEVTCINNAKEVIDAYEKNKEEIDDIIRNISNYKEYVDSYKINDVPSSKTGNLSFINGLKNVASRNKKIESINESVRDYIDYLYSIKDKIDEKKEETETYKKEHEENKEELENDMDSEIINWPEGNGRILAQEKANAECEQDLKYDTGERNNGDGTITDYIYAKKQVATVGSIKEYHGMSHNADEMYCIYLVSYSWEIDWGQSSENIRPI